MEVHSYLDEARLPYFFCPGCGHGTIVDSLNAAFARLDLDPHDIVIVTDIGCVGLADKYFLTNTLHGLHGRSLTYAEGVKLANPDLEVIVLIGDGGCGIGASHLIHAARRNIGMTVLVFNNLNYGMTGGQHSVTTPPNSVTSTTRFGSLEHPFDICGTVMVNGASYVARSTVFDDSLVDLITAAIQNQGFSLIDIWELCTAYYVPNNQFSKHGLKKTLDDFEFSTGVLINKPKSEFSLAYREKNSYQQSLSISASNNFHPKFTHALKSRMNFILAGAAGMKVGSAADLFCQGAILSDLWASQRNEYPVTVKSGHSISEVVLSPQEIEYMGIDKPNIVLTLFSEGYEQVKKQIQHLTNQDILFIHKNLLPIDTKAKKMVLDFKTAAPYGRKKAFWMLMALDRLLSVTGIYPLDALREAVKINPRFAQQNLAALQAAKEIQLG
jgi:pyruvate/2-oxoacid:ferredoxin oxidoreductase beta subunit/Pyruvate/2-oxoacid:ferredoxin oxidoreductase gamma subunit